MSQKVLVAGTGISGIAAAKLLLKKGGEGVLYDGNVNLDEKKLKENFDEDAKVTVVLGELTRTDLLGVELSIISPGISLEAPFVQVLDEAEIPIWSEIQLAYHCAKGKLAAITGTNGKTTTTALTGEIMKAHYESVFVVGNIGMPYTEHALETTDDSVTVAEVSSFQLETIMDFHPNVSAILNITPDHLDRHKTMEGYIQELWSIPQGQARTRLYYHESSRNNAFNLYEYSTQALSPSWEELIPTGRVFHGNSLEAAAPYTLGETLYFDLRATARPYLVSGFSSADFHSTWTVGESGRISLPLAQPPRSDTLTVEMKFLSIMGGSQRLRVDCGGQTVFEGTVTDYTLRFSFPASLVQDQTLTLDFTYPDAISHLKAGLSEDTRQVAFAVTELTVLDGV